MHADYDFQIRIFRAACLFEDYKNRLLNNIQYLLSVVFPLAN